MFEDISGLARALVDGCNQFPPMMGLPELRAAVAERYGRLQGLELTADGEPDGDLGRVR